MRTRFWLSVLALVLLACASPGGGTGSGSHPRPTRVAPDPSAMASVGRDKGSVLMYVAWEGEYTKAILWQDGTLDVNGDHLHEFDQPAQTAHGGEVSIPSVFRPKTHYAIEADPKHDWEHRGLTWCWILWDNVIRDRGTTDRGAVACRWESP